MYKKIISVCLFIINLQNHVYSSDKKQATYQEVSKTIVCNETDILKRNIKSWKWDQVKIELLDQNELDIFARESIEDIFNTVNLAAKIKTSQNLLIKTMLTQRLFNKNGDKIIK